MLRPLFRQVVVRTKTRSLVGGVSVTLGHAQGRCSLPKWMVIMAKRLPNEHEAIEGAGVATATAARLLSGADLLADVGSYGIARSLAVLALEESVKARTLGAIAAAAAQGCRPRAPAKSSFSNS
jgi:AbiV